jgi:hypothetical protein
MILIASCRYVDIVKLTDSWLFLQDFYMILVSVVDT